MTTTFQHPFLGAITGTVKNDITQFLGIKYASLETRLSASKVFTRYNRVEPVDATSFGSAVKGFPNAFSELDGLNLNVTIPNFDGNRLEKQGKLPVFVFIHGGNFQGGSSDYPQYDQTRIVKLSSDIGLPIIGVTFNYRLGLPGFLTSEELRRAGLPANNGLQDQVNAFLWIRDNIGAFGGDENNITVVGESAGAVSASLLLNAKEPLFRRLIMMSGTSLTLHPSSESEAEAAYTSVISSLGLNHLDESQRVATLLAMAPEDLYNHVPTNLTIGPSIDGSLVPSPELLWNSITKKKEGRTEGQEKHWCNELLIGDCQFDASVFTSALRARVNGIGPLFVQSLDSLKHPEVKQLLAAYGINGSCTDEESLRSILELATDIEYFAPMLTFARGFWGNTYVYHFNEANPWQGKWTGFSTHVLDLAYLFQNFNEFLSTSQRDIAIGFATDMVKFGNGIPPWPASTDENNGAQIYGPSGAQENEKSVHYTLYGSAKDTGRRWSIFEFADTIGLYELSCAWKRFLQGV